MPGRSVVFCCGGLNLYFEVRIYNTFASRVGQLQDTACCICDRAPVWSCIVVLLSGCLLVVPGRSSLLLLSAAAPAEPGTQGRHTLSVCQSGADTRIINISSVQSSPVTTLQQIKEYHNESDLQRSLSSTNYLKNVTRKKVHWLLSPFLTFQCCFPNSE